ncbi:PIG-L family deacetylase [Kitasatospora brasiliensis]|uniref:PIG-L family deacetylase n=1 Tax=Kitasatospora brasiliensis TaxID=3058040 RepID=UPI00293039EB|nr:PIG-L family deacetylase [Kitasatospora sp. K002]
MAIGRRQLLTSVALTALAAPVLAKGTATRAAAATGAAAALGSGPLVMQVVAHEDDDILFMNPDLSKAIADGIPSVTVFVTAGNGTGDPCAGVCWDPAGEPLRTWNRQMGAVNAYSRMAGVGDSDPNTDEIGHWAVEAWTVAGKEVERYVLKDRPVHLVFLNLHDAKLAGVLGGNTDTSIVPVGSPLSGPSTYTAADVVEVLRQLMVTYRPTVLRAQDDLPDSRYWGDHADHIAAARFAGLAALQYGGTLIQVNYRDYNIGDAPVNLDRATAATKGLSYSEYASHDHSTGNYSDSWFSRMYYRWPRGTSWATVNQDGRPQVFVVRSGALHTYWREADGSWGGPVRMADPGGWLVPGIMVATNADGRLEVFARRLIDNHIVSLPQGTPNGSWWNGWADHGNPNAGLGNEDQVGVPVVAAAQDGHLELFVKNGGGGLSAIRQTTPGGAWGTWTDLGGTDLQDPVTAIRNGVGAIEVFASTRSSILGWWQTAPNGGFSGPASIPGARPASPPKAVLDQGGRIELGYREVGTGAMQVSRQTRAGGSWSQSPAALGGHGGVGEPATVLVGGRVVLFERNGGGGVSTTAQTAPNSGYGPWQDLGGTVLDYPAATVDGNGVLYVFAVGIDGRVHYRTATTAGAFSPWQSLPF